MPINEGDISGYAGVGITLGIIGFVFRTLWMQGAEWRALLIAERTNTADARKETTEARADAAAARVDAAAARQEAAEARAMVAECERNHSATMTMLRRLQRQVDDLTNQNGETG